RDRDAVEAVPGSEDTWVLVLRSKDEQGAAEAGQGPGESHALADAAVSGNSAGASRIAAGSDGSPLEATPGARQQPPDAGSGEQRERESEIEPTSENEARQPGGGDDRLRPGDAHRGSRSGSAEGPRNEPPLHQMNGDPVEQDGADHLVNAAAHFEPSSQQSPQRAGEGRGGEAPDHRSRDVDLADHGGGKPAPDEPTLRPDVEQPDGEGDGHREDEEAVTHLAELVEVEGDDEDRRPASLCGEERLMHAAARPGIQAARRVDGHDQARRGTSGQFPRGDELLLVAAGEVCRPRGWI